MKIEAGCANPESPYYIVTKKSEGHRLDICWDSIFGPLLGDFWSLLGY